MSEITDIAKRPFQIRTAGDMTPENMEKHMAWLDTSLHGLETRLQQVERAIIDHESRITALE